MSFLNFIFNALVEFCGSGFFLSWFPVLMALAIVCTVPVLIRSWVTWR